MNRIFADKRVCDVPTRGGLWACEGATGRWMKGAAGRWTLGATGRCSGHSRGGGGGGGGSHGGGAAIT